MTNMQISQIKDGIAQCDRYIAIEGPRAADLRPAKAAQHLAFCHQHKAKLQRVLETGNLSLLSI